MPVGVNDFPVQTGAADGQHSDARRLEGPGTVSRSAQGSQP